MPDDPIHPDQLDGDQRFRADLVANLDSLPIGELAELRRFLGGEKATLLWDGLPVHRRPRDAGLAEPPAVLAGG